MKLQIPIYGPRRITQVYQVSIPKNLLDQLRLTAYDEICFALAAENPQIICIFNPATVTVSMMEDGTMHVGHSR